MSYIATSAAVTSATSILITMPTAATTSISTVTAGSYYGGGVVSVIGVNAGSSMLLSGSHQLHQGSLHIRDDGSFGILLEDGTKIEVAADGKIRIDDSAAKTIYRAARVRDFNPFLNAADQLEEFIRELAPHGVRQDQVLRIPIEHFIHWLVHKAAEKDGEDEPTDVPRLPPVVKRAIPRCRLCGRFLPASFATARVEWCAAVCLSRFIEAKGLRQLRLWRK